MEQPDIVQVFDKWLANRLDNVHTTIPGKIVSYSGHAQRKAKVQPSIKLRNTHNKLLKIDPIENVPIIFPSTSEFNLLFPIKKNDGVLLLFSESSIGNFLNSSGEIVDADDKRRFDLADCIAIPGLWSLSTTPSAPENSDDFFLTFQNALIRFINNTNEIIIKNENGEINISETGIMTVENALGKMVINAAGLITFSNGTEAFIKGTLLATQLVNFLTPITTITTGTSVQNAAALEVIKAAAIAFLTVVNNIKSTDILGK